MKRIELAAIRIDGGTQQRVSIAQDVVAEYADHMKSGIEFPAITVFFDGASYWLADGFHRFHASRLLEREEVDADVRTGTQREAVLYAACANQAHGLKRSNDDKRKAVRTLLGDGEWSQWSDHEIARRSGVSAPFVGDVRRGYRTRPSGQPRSLETVSSERSYTTKHGTESTMRVDNIGRGAEKGKSAVVERRDRIRDMAAEGNTVQQIAEEVGLGERTVAQFINEQGVDLPAGRTVGKARRHDANRIIEQMVMDAENLTADVNLIAFESIDPARLGVWINSLNSSKNALNAFIRQLAKEHQKHVEAA